MLSSVASVLSRAKLALCFGFAFCLRSFIVRPALAQNTPPAEIRGTVTDSSGGGHFQPTLHWS